MKHGKRERTLEQNAAKGRAAIEHVKHSPERFIVCDKYGNTRYVTRSDSTLKVRGLTECHPKIRVEGIDTKPVGLVTDWTPALRKLAKDTDKAMRKNTAALRKLPDGNSMTHEAGLQTGWSKTGNANNMVSERGDMVTGPHILAKFVSTWNTKR